MFPTHWVVGVDGDTCNAVVKLVSGIDHCEASKRKTPITTKVKFIKAKSLVFSKPQTRILLQNKSIKLYTDKFLLLNSSCESSNYVDNDQIPLSLSPNF